MNTSALIIGIIDDDPTLIAVMQELFSTTNHTIIPFAIDSLKIDPTIVLKVDILLMDYMMEKMNGIDLYLLLQEFNGPKLPPTYLISSYPKLHELAEEYSFAGFLKKPFNLDELLNLLSNV